MIYHAIGRKCCSFRAGQSPRAETIWRRLRPGSGGERNRPFGPLCRRRGTGIHIVPEPLYRSRPFFRWCLKCAHSDTPFSMMRPRALGKMKINKIPLGDIESSYGQSISKSAEVTIRKAKPEDAQICGEICY